MNKPSVKGMSNMGHNKGLKDSHLQDGHQKLGSHTLNTDKPRKAGKISSADSTMSSDNDADDFGGSGYSRGGKVGC